MPSFAGSVATPEKVVDACDEQQEIADHQRNMTWIVDSRKEFLRWYERMSQSGGGGGSRGGGGGAGGSGGADDSSSSRTARDVQMFVARYCDLLDVEISCDGCGNTLPGRRYRCLQCKDMDLCSTCFAGAVSFKVHMHFYECQICYHLHLCINFTVFLSV